MKHAELRERNTPGGYWVAAVNPAAARHGVYGSVPASNVTRAAVLTDGAARIVTPFAVRTWMDALDLLDTAGPQRLIDEVRQHERADAAAMRWPRNKISDDATAVVVRTSPRSPATTVSELPDRAPHQTDHYAWAGDPRLGPG